MRGGGEGGREEGGGMGAWEGSHKKKVYAVYTKIEIYPLKNGTSVSGINLLEFNVVSSRSSISARRERRRIGEVRVWRGRGGWATMISQTVRAIKYRLALFLEIFPNPYRP